MSYTPVSKQRLSVGQNTWRRRSTQDTTNTTTTPRTTKDIKKDLAAVLPSSAHLLRATRRRTHMPKDVERELRLEHQKIRVVLQHILLHRRPPTFIRHAYARRLADITRFLKTQFGAACGMTCCPKRDPDVSTCDVTAETAVAYVRGGERAFREAWRTARAKLERDRRTCRRYVVQSGGEGRDGLREGRDGLGVGRGGRGRSNRSVSDDACERRAACAIDWRDFEAATRVMSGWATAECLCIQARDLAQQARVVASGDEGKRR